MKWSLRIAMDGLTSIQNMAEQPLLEHQQYEFVLADIGVRAQEVKDRIAEYEAKDLAEKIPDLQARADINLPDILLRLERMVEDMEWVEHKCWEEGFTLGVTVTKQLALVKLLTAQIKGAPDAKQHKDLCDND